MTDPRLEYCSACGEPTGNAGAGDGSIFWLDGAIGPLCPECNSVLRDEVLDDANVVGEPSEVDGMRWIKPEDIESQAFYWWWNGDEDAAPVPVSVMFSGTCGEYFASVGQYGWTEPQFVTDMGGWWMKLAEPSIAALAKREERG